MKKNLFVLGALGLLAMFTACNSASSGYTVTGTMPDSTFNGKTIYIVNYDNNERIDSTVVKGDKYVFKGGNVDTALVAIVSTDRGNMPFLFALENGNIVITEDAEYDYNPTGTPLNDELTRLSNAMASINNAYAEAYEAFEGSREEWNEISENEWLPRFKQHIIENCQAHKDDVAGYMLSQSMTSVLSVDEQLELLNSFGPWLLSTNRVSAMKETLEAQQNTVAGKSYIDIKGTDINGNPVALSDYVGKGNYVLVDMWASWCGPCKREIPNLRKLHDLYKNKGLTVLGIYVWDEIENLAPAMEKEGVVWPQIIDSNETATKLYGVQGIPCIMLIGPDGTILDRTNLRGENMQPTVEKFMFGK